MLASQLVVMFTILLTVAIAILVVGSYNLCFGLYIKAYCKAKTKQKVLALSFDDGPHPEYTAKVLEILKEHNIKAGFFLVGEMVKKEPGLAKQIITDGHIIGNHSYTHTKKFTIRRTGAVIADLKQNEELIQEVTGKKVGFFRPPFGVTNPNIAAAARFLEYKVIGWSIRSLDTMGKRDENIINRVVTRFKPGSIILLHDTHEGIGNILQGIIGEAKKHGYAFVRPDDLLKLEAYK
jgi:peptidoglycan/xylan/chitin deacetylase (PgdA/CDA1 family)